MAERMRYVFGCPDTFSRLAASNGGSLVSWMQSDSGAVQRSVTAKLQEIVSVEDFADASDPDDTLRIRRACAAIVARGGGTLWFQHGKDYTVFTGAPASQVIVGTLSGTNGVTVELNGATITSARVNSTYGDVLFLAASVENLAIRGGSWVGGATATIATNISDSEYFLSLSGGPKNVTVENVSISRCSNGITHQDEATRAVGLQVRNCYFELCYYPLSLYNYDDVEATITTRNCGRSYFPKAPCNNHTINLDSQSGFSSADCLLWCDIDSTKTVAQRTFSNITINYTSAGRTVGAGNVADAIVYLDFRQTATNLGAGYMRNVRVNFAVNGLNAAGASADKPYNLIQVVKRLSDGSADGTPRGHVLDGLVVSGSVINWNNSLGGGALICDGVAGAGAGTGWTGDVVSGVALRDLRISGAPAGDAVYLNGQGSVSGAPFASMDSVYCDGNLAYANVSTARIREGNISFANLQAVRAYTPSWTGSGGNPAIGDGTLTGTLHRDGDWNDVTIEVTPGAATTFGSGGYELTLPNVCAATGAAQVGISRGFDSGVSLHIGVCALVKNTNRVLVYLNDDAGAISSGWSATYPWTFKNGDTVQVTIRYRS